MPLCDSQAKAKTAVSSWDVTNPVVWDLGFGTLAAFWDKVGVAFWVLGIETVKTRRNLVQSEIPFWA